MISEDREYGKVSFSVYKNYFDKNGGIFFMILAILIMIVWVFANLGSNIWVDYWVSANDPQHNTFYLEVYAILSLSFGFMCTLRAFILAYRNLVCSRIIHQSIINSLLCAPIVEFYERIPMGYILNRLTKDLLTTDTYLPYYIGSLLVNIFSTIRNIAMCSYVLSYWSVLPLVVMIVLGYLL